MAAGIVFFRFVQYAAAALLFGLPLFFLLVFPRAATPARGMKSITVLAATALLAGTSLGLLAQTAMLAGSLSEAFNPATLGIVFTQMDFGASAAARMLIAGVTLVILLLARPGRNFWRLALLGGGLACISMAWMGHGGATKGAPGYVHLIADVLHILAASGWLGGLAAFSILLLQRAEPTTLDRSLRNFAGIGFGLVALILATGLVNSYFLVGLDRLSGLWTTPYGQLLSLKLILFAVMLGFAARNRLSLSPALDQALATSAPPGPALAALRRSILGESAIAALVLGVVAWLGTLAPVTAAS